MSARPGHRQYLGGTGCFRSSAPRLPSRYTMPVAPCFVCRDQQAEMLPKIIAEQHRAKLARNREDCC